MRKILNDLCQTSGSECILVKSPPALCYLTVCSKFSFDPTRAEAFQTGRSTIESIGLRSTVKAVRTGEFRRAGDQVGERDVRRESVWKAVQDLFRHG